MTVIFVCTGNTCRSPLAEGIARQIADERGLTDLSFASAGTSAFLGSPASDGAILIGLERGFDLSRHRSQPFSADLIDNDTIVFGLTQSHVSGIRAIAPAVRVYLLDDYASHGNSKRSVSDPFGGDLREYRAAADQIETMFRAALDRLVAESASGH